MTDSNQSLRINGQQLSNLDPDLVITLDDHPVVQISKILESTITYSFLGNVSQETSYNLNLTFLYKGTHKLVVPMTFLHKPTTLTFDVSPKSISGKAQDQVLMKGTILYNGSSIPFNSDGLTIKAFDVDSSSEFIVTVVDGSATADSIKLLLNQPAGSISNGDAYFILSYKGMSGQSDTFSWQTVQDEAEPIIEDGTTDMTLNLWDTKSINYKVMLGDTDITSSVTNVVDQTDPNDAIELVKVDDTHWGYQAISARTDEDLIIDAMVDVYVTYQGTDHVIPMTIDVVVKANTTGIPANRFNIEFV